MADCVFTIAVFITGLIILLIWRIINSTSNSVHKFNDKLKEIEDILDSPDAKKRKSELFMMLDKLSINCNNYDDLTKLRLLLIRVYEL